MRKPSGIALINDRRQLGLREWPGDDVLGRIFTCVQPVGSANRLMARKWAATPAITSRWNTSW
jgi:hypothetical protein